MLRRGNFAGFDGPGPGCGCGCAGGCAPRQGFGGIFAELLDAAGATIGDPGLGNQVAATASPGFAPITQTPAQVATTVLPSARSALQDPGSVDTSKITSQSAQVAQAALPQTAQALAAAGYTFAPGTVGASLTAPSVFDAFGGQNERWVILAGLGLGGLLLLKALR